jgi:8-oxo-dGTP diphosphatase
MSVNVVIGIIRNREGSVLVSKRKRGTHLLGFWEFPGGKVENGEKKISALKRELREELGIDVKELCPLLEVSHRYDDKEIRISAFEVFEWTGQPVGREGQVIRWVKEDALRSLRFPSANGPIITSMGLPSVTMITGPFTGDRLGFLRKTEDYLKAGISLIQFRPQTITKGVVSLGRELVALCDQYGARVFANSDIAIFEEIAAHGFHLKSRSLTCGLARKIPLHVPLSCSCHNESEIRKAEELGAEFIYLGSVAATSSHPGQKGLGWDLAGRWARLANMPVFALGGMSPSDIKRAKCEGFQGVAMLSGFWETGAYARTVVEECCRGIASAHFKV